MGTRAFSVVQYGAESSDTPGTAVAATTRIFGAQVPPLEPDRMPHFPAEATNDRFGIIRSYFGQYLWQTSLAIEDGYFQILPMLFSIGVKGQTAGVVDTDSYYLYSLSPNIVASDGSNTLNTITLELGDDVQGYEIEHVMCDSIKISGQIGQGNEASLVKVEASLFGRQVTGTTLTPASDIAVFAPAEMNAKLCQLYVDSTWAAVGNTEKTGTLRAFDMEILTGVHPQFHGGANKYFDTHGEGSMSAKLTLTLEGNATADDIWDRFNTQELVVVRLKLSNGLHYAQFDIGGHLESVTPLSEVDRGANLHAMVLTAIRDTTADKAIQVAIHSNRSAI
jgi:hypothetical protein